ncbi:MAG: NAD(P)/FAD-dependent oxidoreductase [Dehalococcoidia bacterium]|nr:NAD(P)/FAD-dependent oxidoreductase [Dehalococcoidia bacterium]
MYDAIIVGARCGGAPLAMNLARKGYRVLAVDRAHFPSDTLSTHCLTGDSMMRLVTWGVIPKLMAAGCRPVRTVRMASGGQAHKVELPDGVFSLNPRRTVIDTVLVDAARDAGAEVREGFTVTGLLRDASGAVSGIEGHGEGGGAVREEARIVVGADGRHSMVAKAVGAEEYGTLPGLTCGWYSYFEGFDDDGTEVWYDDGQAVLAFPTNDGLTCLAAVFPIEQFEARRAGIDGTVAGAFAVQPAIGERYAAARRVEPWYGMRSPTWYYRRPYGPGWALAGDAGYLKDPILGQGMNDAFRDADMLTAALDRSWSGGEPLEAALAAYQRERDEVTAEMCRVNYEFSRLKNTPEMVAMRLAAIPGGAG